jgi:SAM-dependent methyltransferase
MPTGWLRLYLLSVRLGLRYLARHGWLREALIRVVAPLDPSRYLEFPETLRALQPGAGDEVLDLASPKLVATFLAGRGVRVTSVDQLPEEVERWRKLTAGRPNLKLAVADGRELPFADGRFDHAYSISVLEHIPDDGDLTALRELARVVKPGGRVVLTLPYAEEYWEDWRQRPVYAPGDPQRGQWFFGRWYDEAHTARLVAAAAPELELQSRRLARLSPIFVNRTYERLSPWLAPLAWLTPFVTREVDGAGGDMLRLTFVRTA